MRCMCPVWFFFCKQKTAYEMRISDWSSDVCSSDLQRAHVADQVVVAEAGAALADHDVGVAGCFRLFDDGLHFPRRQELALLDVDRLAGVADPGDEVGLAHEEGRRLQHRSEEHTSELQSLMRISYAVFCLKKTKTTLWRSRYCYTYYCITHIY